jgi:hypothetical protein
MVFKHIFDVFSIAFDKILRAMPSIDSLMQVWPQEFEELLKEVIKNFFFIIRYSSINFC